MRIAMTDFASERHFNPDFAGTKILDMSPREFVALLTIIQTNDLEKILCAVNPRYKAAERGDDLHAILKDGYAPFCKHLFVRNFTEAKMGVASISVYNRQALKSGYAARREGELPVLTRWFEQEDLLKLGFRQDAQWLDIILYDKAQLSSEGVALPEDKDWGIVAILSSSGPEEAPMKPITMMRNALGKEEGGSGVALDREAYEASVAYWETHATVR